MKYSAVVLATLLASAFARPGINEHSHKARNHARDVRAPHSAYVHPRWNIHLNRREVPQEHSHEKFLTGVGASLNLNNPDKIADPVFGLLGAAAAAQDCLQQATADQAFTNAKAAGDITGMTDALVYRALERNTGSVGLASKPCTSITAVNPEIAALQQHQDPASDNAAATNKQITLTLAVQIASIGGDPTTALQSGTFAPGKIGDPTAAGNTCDDANDPVGCIFTQNLLVEDATVDEINAAVAAGSAGSSNASSSTAGQAVSNTTTLVVDSSSVASSTDSNLAIQTAIDQAASTMMMTMVVTETVTECTTAASVPAGMTAVTMPVADASTVINIAISLGVQINIGDSGSTVFVADPAIATQTAVQLLSNSALATASITNVAAAATTSVDCSEAISSALAAAGLAGAGALTGTSAASATLAPPPPPPPAAGASNTTTSTLDLGSCPNPTIIFALGLDGRKDPSFAPADETTFTHGSALNIKVITDFICQQLGVKCKASTATIDACNQGATAAQGVQGQAAADAFNAALGF